MSSATIDEQYYNICKDNSWTAVFEKLNLSTKDFPCTETNKLKNKPYNRYRDVKAFDHSRVVLKRTTHNYINANLVNMGRASRRYILTQGPLSVTVGHFWLMVWEQNTTAILMLNKLVEKNESKCCLYWPLKTGDSDQLELHKVQLKVNLLDVEEFADFTIRHFELIDLVSGENRKISQFHYTTWPDFGVPSSPDAFLTFLYKVRQSGCLENNVGPAVIHCSAGIGRSGTFCLVDACLAIIEKERTLAIDVQDILLEMRRDRMGLIQTPDQLQFSFLAIIEGAKQLDPTYESSLNENQISLLSPIVEQEEIENPPPPPPRSESLSQTPNRALPDIPVEDNINKLLPVDHIKWPLPRTAEVTPNRLSIISTEEQHSLTSPMYCADEISDLRQRIKEPLDFIAPTSTSEKKDRRESITKKLCHPLTLTVSVILTGIIVYAYIRR